MPRFHKKKYTAPPRAEKTQKRGASVKIHGRGPGRSKKRNRPKPRKREIRKYRCKNKREILRIGEREILENAYTERTEEMGNPGLLFQRRPCREALLMFSGCVSRARTRKLFWHVCFPSAVPPATRTHIVFLRGYLLSFALSRVARASLRRRKCFGRAIEFFAPPAAGRLHGDMAALVLAWTTPPLLTCGTLSLLRSSTKNRAKRTQSGRKVIGGGRKSEI